MLFFQMWWNFEFYFCFLCFSTIYYNLPMKFNEIEKNSIYPKQKQKIRIYQKLKKN